jgi:hypothetical protein
LLTPGVFDKDQSTEEPDEGRSFKSGFEEAGGGATRLLTLT